MSTLERKLKFLFVRLTLSYETFVRRKSNPSLDARRNQAIFYFQFIYWHHVLGMG
jgi:hypothetical protein